MAKAMTDDGLQKKFSDAVLRAFMRDGQDHKVSELAETMKVSEKRLWRMLDSLADVGQTNVGTPLGCEVHWVPVNPFQDAAVKKGREDIITFGPTREAMRNFMFQRWLESA